MYFEYNKVFEYTYSEHLLNRLFEYLFWIQNKSVLYKTGHKITHSILSKEQFITFMNEFNSEKML